MRTSDSPPDVDSLVCPASRQIEEFPRPLRAFPHRLRPTVGPAGPAVACLALHSGCIGGGTGPVRRSLERLTAVGSSPQSPGWIGEPSLDPGGQHLKGPQSSGAARVAAVQNERLIL